MYFWRVSAGTGLNDSFITGLKNSLVEKLSTCSDGNVPYWQIKK